MSALQIIGIVLGAAILIGLAGIRIRQEYERGLIFRLGRYREVKGPGIFWIIPLIERQRAIDIRVDTVVLEQQETVTKDSVTIKVNAVLWFLIVDPAKPVIAVANVLAAVYQVALTSLRTIIGQHALDEILKERNTINEALRVIVDEATEHWGVRIEMVEIKDVEIPPAMQRAMAREAEAVREKRARLIKAEAEEEASSKLSAASARMMANPIALELRRLQMVSEVGADHNSTTVVLVPSDFVTLASTVTEKLRSQRVEGG